MHEKPGIEEGAPGPPNQVELPVFNESVKRGTAQMRGKARGSVEVERTVRSAEDVGRLLRDRRRQQGLSQEELADLADSHRNRIAELEQGKPTERVALILRALNELGLELVVRSRNVHRGDRP